ncbi:iron-sulfur cluster assembly scaffold protein NifU [Halolactibacillus alkaliphilus]|uniref:Iron-sulfur cluster assembly scaffold protein NifU n=1 Tax=Halolactibacillus alkaliphilus TaxID=442899 RepID=A0A511X320_9BACI|nr:SUF system NifU family Fe-S cluster assembly protein [Halolactibacillus alkaliphilus]GEN57350.1 iron-sulfur cluster assembly scaffold protein NifU [Halolactibacillus alkaliphilus]GGN73072.1 iron-sulfur cluster assembly scaffold protein NifU [Halolactibacillus alkaliphilus]SFO94489.1 nitrogen fixation protein NifU [Halolactibacillus alkaliphilus]
MSFNNLDTLYRQVIMDHYKNPRNKGTLNEGLTLEMNNPTCGDRIQLHFIIEGEVVIDAKFEGEGCSISLASASMMTQVVKGKSVEEALKLSQYFSNMMLGKETDSDDLELGDIEALQGVQKFPARIKCATLAWKAMEKAIDQEDEM